MVTASSSEAETLLSDVISSPQQQYSNVEVQRGASMANRATSCQLPGTNVDANTEPAHRQTQSIDLGTTDLHICWNPPRHGKTDRDFSKYDKRKGRRVLLAVQLAVLLFLIPGAFLAGYCVASMKISSAAVTTPPQRLLPIAGSLGRQLSHDGPAEVISVGASRGIADDTVLWQSKVLAQQSATKILFVTWIAFGEFGDGGFHTHNFHKVDMRWAEMARRSHPGCKIGLIMDQDTLLDESISVDFLHRLEISKQQMGRNEYNDFYHWTARYSFLEKLMAEGEDSYNVVFLDPDVFVLGSIEEVFDHSGFDYATTISENSFQPINGAMHFVRAHRYGAAVDVLKGVLSLFQLRPEMGFTAGQQAYADFFELTADEELVKQMQTDAVEDGIGCHSVKEGDFNICYFICTKYNFWEECSDHPAMQVRPEEAEDYAAVGVKVFHFIAYRKLGMQRVYDAYIEGGLEAAQKAWAALPHDEDGYDNDPTFADEA